MFGSQIELRFLLRDDEVDEGSGAIDMLYEYAPPGASTRVPVLEVRTAREGQITHLTNPVNRARLDISPARRVCYFASTNGLEYSFSVWEGGVRMQEHLVIGNTLGIGPLFTAQYTPTPDNPALFTLLQLGKSTNHGNSFLTPEEVAFLMPGREQLRAIDLEKMLKAYLDPLASELGAYLQGGHLSTADRGIPRIPKCGVLAQLNPKPITLYRIPPTSPYHQARVYRRTDNPGSYIVIPEGQSPLGNLFGAKIQGATADYVPKKTHHLVRGTVTVHRAGEKTDAPPVKIEHRVRSYTYPSNQSLSPDAIDEILLQHALDQIQINS